MSTATEAERGQRLSLPTMTIADNGAGQVTLELVPFSWPTKEALRRSEVLVERASSLGRLAGTRTAERLLEQGEKIPKEWERFQLVCLKTAFWDRSIASEVVCYLYRCRGPNRWCMSSKPLSEAWGNKFWLVVIQNNGNGH